MSSIIEPSSIGFATNKRMRNGDEDIAKISSSSSSSLSISNKNDHQIDSDNKFNVFHSNIIHQYFPSNNDYITQQQQSRSLGFIPNILYDYIDHPDKHKPFIFLETNNCIVIYDVYPKAYLHLLILPKRHFLNISVCRDIEPQHVDQITEMHQLANYIATTITSTNKQEEEEEGKEKEETLIDDKSKNIKTVRELMIAKNMTKNDIWIGYHTIPSLRPLHIHLITHDLCSSYLKNKLHWNSYTTPFFLPINRVDEILDNNQTVNEIHPSKDVLEAYLKEPLKCNICGIILKNIPTLKAHQKNIHQFEYHE